MTPEGTKQAVGLGAALMDKADPNWWREDVPLAVDLGDLDMTRSDLCILGQRCPLEILSYGRRGYAYEMYALHLSGIVDDSDALHRWAVRHGFNANDLRAYDLLGNTWKDLIIARREAARQVTT